MTRADWYARTGGGWRTARTAHRCDRVDQYRLRCTGRMLPGARYFDTNQHNPHGGHQFAKIKLCGACAEIEIST